MSAAPALLASLIGLLLLYAAWGDLRRREIPNYLNGLIALCAPVAWYILQLDAAQIGWQIALAFAIFLPFALLFFVGGIGGGDVKMLGAMALWIRPSLILPFLLLMALVGGGIAAVMILRRRMGRGPEKPELPYGVAISAAGFWVIYQQFVNHFPLNPVN
ncbi:MAG: prepilin peptidase [Sphingomonadaceae bacterium]|nr:prepilin peptidase [Sphingomonadaceae bacterium]